MGGSGARASCSGVNGVSVVFTRGGTYVDDDVSVDHNTAHHRTHDVNPIVVALLQQS